MTAPGDGTRARAATAADGGPDGRRVVRRRVPLRWAARLAGTVALLGWAALVSVLPPLRTATALVVAAPAAGWFLPRTSPPHRRPTRGGAEPARPGVPPGAPGARGCRVWTVLAAAVVVTEVVALVMRPAGAAHPGAGLPTLSAALDFTLLAVRPGRILVALGWWLLGRWWFRPAGATTAAVSGVGAP